MTLSKQDAEKFFEIAIPLLLWVKKRNRKSKAVSKQAWKDKRFDAREARDIWNAIWERPELLERYLKQKGGTLTEETKCVLSDWLENFIPGPFIVTRYLDEGAVFISSQDGRVYLVSGITSPIEESLAAKDLPCQVKTFLIPFQGRVIYDSILESEPGVIVSTAAQTLNQVYQDAKRDGNLIRRLPSDVPPPDGERWRGVVQTLTSLREKEEAVNSEELLRKVLNSPDVHILSERDLSVLTKMLKKPHRSEKDWGVVKDILLDADLFTIEPPRSKKIRAVEGVLYEDGTMMAFTSLQKCQAYLRKLSGEQGAERYYINVISCETLFEIAEKKKSQLVIDKPENPFQMFFVYDSQTKRLGASVMIPRLKP